MSDYVDHVWFPFRRRFDVALVGVDSAVSVLVALFAFRLRFEHAHLGDHYVHVYQVGTALTAVMAVTFGRVCGLYRRDALRLGRSNVEAAFTAGLLSGVALLVLNVVVLGSDLSRGWVALVAFGLVLGGVSSRNLLRYLRRLCVPFGFGFERYLLVGDDPVGRRLHDDLVRAPGAPFRIVGVLSRDLSAEQIAVQARRLSVDGLILDPTTEQQKTGFIAAALSGTGIDVLVAPQFGQLESRVASIAVLQGVPLLRVAGMAPRRKAEREQARDRTRRGVAVLGTRGIPANYGGFETFAERLALFLVDQGITPTVYCRAHYASEQTPWRGINLVTLPTIRSKYLDTVVHTGLSALHLVLRGGARDVVLCNAANAPVLLLLRLARRRVILNVDGLEWRRSKWGVAGRSWYRLGEWLSVRLASVLVTDAYEVQTYYRVRHDSDSVMIPYGADLLVRGGTPVPAETPVRLDGYALYVSRWERENNPLMVALAHAEGGADLDLVMLGSATYDEQLAKDVHAAAGPRSHLPGALFGDAYRGLQSNALCYIHATEVGGTHPALIEAMGAGNICLVLDTPENREVAGPAGVFFSDQSSLAGLLAWVVGLDPDERDAWRARAREHAAARYSWAAVGQSYIDLLKGHGSR